MSDESEIEIIASRFHGGLAFCHAIAVWFNIRKKNYVDAAVHLVFVAYDTASAVSHHKQSGDKS